MRTDFAFRTPAIVGDGEKPNGLTQDRRKFVGGIEN
jgi:hypothetical protein